MLPNRLLIRLLVLPLTAIPLTVSAQTESTIGFDALAGNASDISQHEEQGFVVTPTVGTMVRADEGVPFPGIQHSDGFDSSTDGFRVFRSDRSDFVFKRVDAQDVFASGPGFINGYQRCDDVPIPDAKSCVLGGNLLGGPAPGASVCFFDVDCPGASVCGPSNAVIPSVTVTVQCDSCDNPEAFPVVVPISFIQDRMPLTGKVSMGFLGADRDTVSLQDFAVQAETPWAGSKAPGVGNLFTVQKNGGSVTVTDMLFTMTKFDIGNLANRFDSPLSQNIIQAQSFLEANVDFSLSFSGAAYGTIQDSFLIGLRRGFPFNDFGIEAGVEQETPLRMVWGLQILDPDPKMRRTGISTPYPITVTIDFSANVFAEFYQEPTSSQIVALPLVDELRTVEAAATFDPPPPLCTGALGSQEIEELRIQGDWVLDNIVVETVPEPTAGIAAACAIAVLLVLRETRRTRPDA